MGKKMMMMKLPFLFKNHHHNKDNATKQHQTLLHHPWQWPSCNNPKTLSFRVIHGSDDIFKTVNSVYFDDNVVEVETPETWFTNSSESASFSTESDAAGDESLEMVVRGARSERLFFEPGGDTSSLFEVKRCAHDKDEEEEKEEAPFEESVVLAMESEDPYVDFKRSMEEMVETHGLKDWERLEELLAWYLKVNGKMNHGFIVDAFVDLLVNISCSDSSSSTTCYSSALSCLSSSSSLSPPPLCCEIEDEDENIRLS